MLNRFLIIGVIILFTNSIFSQSVKVEGYVFEVGNRGYLNQVNIKIIDDTNQEVITTISSDNNGFFNVNLPTGKVYTIEANKNLFEKKVVDLNAVGKVDGEKVFVKIQMVREPGYLFEVTMAPKRDNEDIAVEAIKGALIEVYNNTTQEEVMFLENHPQLDFNVHFKKGNHYTVLIRKDGFLAKRMEAYVNVEGCILCFEGVGEVRPAVAENLTEGLDMGTLLANVELEPIYKGKTMEIPNIYYEFGSSKLTEEGKASLRKLASVLYDNPFLNVELGSHTDVRGKDSANQKLSLRRATSAVDYLTREMKIRKDRILARGYGESMIKNKCKTGIDCTEEEHAENRRTEIKILEINQDFYPPKSLYSMKKEEEFERMVLSEGVETIGNINIDSVEKVSSEENGIIESRKNMESKEDSIQNEIEGFSEEVINNLPVEKAKNAKPKTLTFETEDSSYKARRMEEESRERIEKAKMREKVNTNSETNAFTGYSIVVYFNNFALPEDHAIFRLGDIHEYISPEKNFFYHTGKFNTEEEAEKYRLVYLEKNYPNSYVIQIKDGVRIK